MIHTEESARLMSIRGAVHDYLVSVDRQRHPEEAMKYLYMIYLDTDSMEALPADELEAVQEEAGAYTEELRASGRLLSSEALEPAGSAATVRVRNGDLSVTDGPYAETKEQLGGIVAIEAHDLNDAIQVASKDPAARYGSVEVRAIAWSSRD
jgi:hypothetical protein